MASAASALTTINNFITSASEDLTTVGSVLKNGMPTDPTQISLVVLAALRILSGGLIAASTIFGFTAMQMNNLSQLVAIFPTVVAPAITAIIVFHDIYVGSSTIALSLKASADTSAEATAEDTTTATTTTAVNLSFASAKVATGASADKATAQKKSIRRHPDHVRFRNGKTLTEVLKEGTSSFADEVTENMWALKWVLRKTNRFWAPAVAKRFYNVSFPTVATETQTA